MPEPSPRRPRLPPFARVLAGILGGTLVVQLLGVLRHVVIAGRFGVSAEMDLYTLVLAIATIGVFGSSGSTRT